MLGVVLVVSAVLNIVTSLTVSNVAVGIVFGMITLGCAAAFVRDHYRRRRNGSTVPPDSVPR
ncbi:hypothetical protein [Nonomuraea sp. NPDC002799]